MKAIEQDTARMEEIIMTRMQETPHNPALHYEFAMIALRGGAIDDGVRWLESALKEDPKYAPAHRTLASYYQQQGDAAQAARHRELGRQ